MGQLSVIAPDFQLPFIREICTTHLGCALWPKFWIIPGRGKNKIVKSESALCMMSGNDVNDPAYAFLVGSSSSMMMII